MQSLSASYAVNLNLRAQNLRDEAIVSTWQAMLPNLMSTALDIAGLFRDLDLGPGDEDDPEWLRLHNVKVLLPRSRVVLLWASP